MKHEQINIPGLGADAKAFLARPKRLLIDGKWVDAASGKTFDSIDPATEQVICQIAEGDKADVDKAVKAARKAFEGDWSKTRPADRERLLLNLADLLAKHADELAELEALDVGKVLMFAKIVDVAGTIEYLRYMAGWATKVEGHTLDVSCGMPGQEFQAFTLRQPHGVCGQIIPWNFPLAMCIWKLSPALATGNTCVLKPAEQTCLTALRLGELVLEAGFPAGVVNIITGYGHTAGAALVAHPDVDKIAFTGSTPVGKLIGKSAMDTMKRVSLELGGKSPVVMMADSDIETAVGGAANAIFFNQGQVCTAGSRLYVHKKIFDKVVEGLAGVASSFKLGSGLDPANNMGPLVSKEQFDRVLSYIDKGRKEGGTVVTGGERALDKGYFVKPTVFTNVKPDATIVKEEIFGPVVVATPFDDVDEVARTANDTVFGLGASIWTRDISLALKLARRIKAGSVWINTHNIIDPNLPFGGFKQSGFGREMGREAIEMYTEPKSVLIQL
jgi:phenylacetaldehyde dehydrogenase